MSRAGDNRRRSWTRRGPVVSGTLSLPGIQAECNVNIQKGEYAITIRQENGTNPRRITVNGVRYVRVDDSRGGKARLYTEAYFDEVDRLLQNGMGKMAAIRTVADTHNFSSVDGFRKQYDSRHADTKVTKRKL